MKHGFIFRQFLQYVIRSRSKHGVHSPFVYKLAADVFPERSFHSLFKTIEKIRTSVYADRSVISVNDLGAGSHKPAVNKTVGRIARHSSKTPAQARLLYRIVDHLNPSVAIELGTSVGISAMYQAAAIPQGRFITIEGCQQTAAIAKKNIEASGIKNIEQVTGDFDTVLPELLKKHPDPGYVYIDGNHRLEPTLKYFELLLGHAHNDLVLVFDDIHWSPGMLQAWQTICAHPQVTVTIDLFHFGLVFFWKELSKEDFVIRY